MAPSASAVTTKLTRASVPRKFSRIRAAVFNTHELSLVYGSSTTLARWNVVNHSSSGRVSPPSAVNFVSRAGLLATAADGSAPAHRAPMWQ